jgi:hypothetical protein
MGRCVRIKPALIGSHLGWSTIAMPSEEPSVVVASGERDECGPQLFDGIAGSHPQQILFQGSDEALSRTKEGEASIPRHSTRQSLILTSLDWPSLQNAIAWATNLCSDASEPVRTTNNNFARRATNRPQSDWQAG